MKKSKLIGLVAGPLVFILLLIFPFGNFSAEAWKVISVASLMLIWWVTEAIPIPVTALLPIILFPLLEVSDSKAAAAPYASPIVFLFFGGFMIALAMEKWSLHKRIALGIIQLTGTGANKVILGFMLATAFLSMWISNTATTVMMLPIAASVLNMLATENKLDVTGKDYKRFALALMLSIAYSANIGGMATLIGTPPNLVLAGFLKETYSIDLSFGTWILIGLPIAVILLFVLYTLLTKMLYKTNLKLGDKTDALIASEMIKLGSLKGGEKRVLIVFVLTALLWVFRTSINKMLDTNVLTDTGIAMLAALSFYLIPADKKSGSMLLKWTDTKELPWGILLLFGGGLSLASALYKVGLIEQIGAAFSAMDNSQLFILLLGLTLVALFMTEVMSNVALTAVFVPVVAGVALGVRSDVLLFTIPVTLAASCAFMLPMSTPPNAIVFASGHIKVADMVRTGIILNVISVAVITLFCYYLLGFII